VSSYLADYDARTHASATFPNLLRRVASLVQFYVEAEVHAHRDQRAKANPPVPPAARKEIADGSSLERHLAP
jgi:hypothetical protein